MAITLAHLIAVEPSDSAEHLLSRDIYGALLRKAIDRELIIQTARQQNISLTEHQEQQLETRRAEIENSGPNLVQNITKTPAAISFELRDVAALMLKISLAERAGVRSPHVTPLDLQQLTLSFPDAAAKPETELRAQLARAIREEHQRQLEHFVTACRSKADISIVNPIQAGPAFTAQVPTASALSVP